MPYGYYQFVRFISMVVFVILGYYALEEKREVEAIIFFALAVLFQPLFKIALGRTIWNIVDVVVGVGLIVSIFYPDNLLMRTKKIKS
jgi:Gpi18-like mannosyltransferase